MCKNHFKIHMFLGFENSKLSLNPLFMVPCIFLQPFSSAYFFFSWYCWWHQRFQPAIEKINGNKRKREKP